MRNLKRFLRYGEKVETTQKALYIVTPRKGVSLSPSAELLLRDLQRSVKRDMCRWKRLKKAALFELLGDCAVLVSLFFMIILLEFKQ